jgi:hypothetical protein
MSVSDTGIGISEREQRRLFEKFFQPKIPVHPAFRSTGLGLAIVKEIVQLHGGTVRVESEPGEGTVFKVSLPIYSPAFALTEEFRVMREQVIREGGTLTFHLLQAGSGASFGSNDVAVLQRNVSREDRVLLNPRGGWVILSMLDPADLPAFQQRLKEVLNSHSEIVYDDAVQWGWVLVPQEGTELADVLRLAEKRCRGQSSIRSSDKVRV